MQRLLVFKDSKAIFRLTASEDTVIRLGYRVIIPQLRQYEEHYLTDINIPKGGYSNCELSYYNDTCTINIPSIFSSTYNVAGASDVFIEYDENIVSIEIQSSEGYINIHKPPTFEDVAEWITSAISGAFQTAMEWLSNAIVNAVNQIIGVISSVIGVITEWIISGINMANDILKNITGIDVFGAIQQGIGTIYNFITGIPTYFYRIYPDIMGSIVATQWAKRWEKYLERRYRRRPRGVLGFITDFFSMTFGNYIIYLVVALFIRFLTNLISQRYAQAPSWWTPPQSEIKPTRYYPIDEIAIEDETIVTFYHKLNEVEGIITSAIEYKVTTPTVKELEGSIQGEVEYVLGKVNAVEGSIQGEIEYTITAPYIKEVEGVIQGLVESILLGVVSVTGQIQSAIEYEIVSPYIHTVEGVIQGAIETGMRIFRVLEGSIQGEIEYSTTAPTYNEVVGTINGEIEYSISLISTVRFTETAETEMITPTESTIRFNEIAEVKIPEEATSKITFNEYVDVIIGKEVEGSIQGEIEYILGTVNKLSGTIQGEIEYTLTLPTVKEVEGTIQGEIEYEVSPSSISPYEEPWMLPQGWTKVWQFNTEEELNDFANAERRNAYVENGKIEFNPPEDDYGDVIREVMKFYRRIAICIKVELVSGLSSELVCTASSCDGNKCKGLYLRTKYNSETELEICDFQGFNCVSFNCPDDWFVIVFDHVDNRIVVYDRNKNIIAETISAEYTAASIVSTIRIDEVKFTGERITDVKVDWVAVLEELPPNMVEGSINGEIEYSLSIPPREVEGSINGEVEVIMSLPPREVEGRIEGEVWHSVALPPKEVSGSIQGEIEFDMHEDSGTDPLDPAWKPPKDYHELYRFFNPNDLDRLFNEYSDGCSIESNSCVNSGTMWCHRDTGLETWSYAFDYMVFAFKYTVKRKPTGDIWYMYIINYKANVMEKGIGVLIQWKPDIEKLGVGSEDEYVPLEPDTWYIIRINMDTRSVEVFDVNGNKIGEAPFREHTPTWSEDYHAIEFNESNDMVYMYIDWMGITKWE